MYRTGPVYGCWRPQPQHLPYPHCQPRPPGIRFRHTPSSQKPSSFSEQSIPPALYPLCRESSGSGPGDMRPFRAGALGTVGTPRQRGGAPARLVGGGHEPGRVGTRGMAVAGAALPGPVEPDARIHGHAQGVSTSAKDLKRLFGGRIPACAVHRASRRRPTRNFLASRPSAPYAPDGCRPTKAMPRRPPLARSRNHSRAHCNNPTLLYSDKSLLQEVRLSCSESG